MTSQSIVATCPEVVHPDDRGQPRDAAGHIRYCWPGDADCYCDQDNDCYATAGYVPCKPLHKHTDAGVEDAGHADAVVADTGHPDTGVIDSGHTDSGAVNDRGVTTDTGVDADSGTVSTSDAALPTVGGCQVFPANNPWNTDISAYPLNPNSDAIIADIQANGETTLKADFGSNTQYGIPYVVVPSTQAFVAINFTEYGDESNPGPYPVPATAPVEYGEDHHVLVVDEGACILYEMYHSTFTNPGWNAGSGAVFNFASNALRPAGWTSCDQAGLPIFPGLTRYDEVTAGAINHALRVTFNNTRNGWIPPATHPGGNSDVNAPPMGMRLRLKASFSLTGFTGESRVILTTLARYGMFVADTGSNWYVSGATDSRWDDDDLSQLMSVPGTAFEVVETGAMQQ